MNLFASPGFRDPRRKAEHPHAGEVVEIEEKKSVLMLSTQTASSGTGVARTCSCSVAHRLLRFDRAAGPTGKDRLAPLDEIAMYR